jgi:hypothetical protein
MRKITAARLADGSVRELSRRPPETLLVGASVSHEVKCFSVVQRRMSVPISAMGFSAVCQPLHVCLNGAITGGQLGLTRVEEFQILLQDEEVLGPIVAG